MRPQASGSEFGYASWMVAGVIISLVTYGLLVARLLAPENVALGFGIAADVGVLVGVLLKRAFD